MLHKIEWNILYIHIWGTKKVYARCAENIKIWLNNEPQLLCVQAAAAASHFQNYMKIAIKIASNSHKTESQKKRYVYCVATVSTMTTNEQQQH